MSSGSGPRAWKRVERLRSQGQSSSRVRAGHGPAFCQPAAGPSATPAQLSSAAIDHARQSGMGRDASERSGEQRRGLLIGTLPVCPASQPGLALPGCPERLRGCRYQTSDGFCIVKHLLTRSPHPATVHFPKRFGKLIRTLDFDI